MMGITAGLVAISFLWNNTFCCSRWSFCILYELTNCINTAWMLALYRGYKFTEYMACMAYTLDTRNTMYPSVMGSYQLTSTRFAMCDSINLIKWGLVLLFRMKRFAVILYAMFHIKWYQDERVFEYNSQ